MAVGCVFCDIIRGGAPAAVVCEDADTIVIMDRYPIDRGHCLVVTREHRQTILDMDAGETRRVFSVVPMVARAALKGLGADAFSVAQNNGRAARQVVPHVHVHVIPRYNDRGTDWSAGRTVPGMDELERLAALIRPHVEAAGQGQAAAAGTAAPPRPGGR